MAFSIQGDYVEACTCDVSCNCIYLGPATKENCDVFLGWHITRGQKDGVDLAGLNAVMAVHTPKQMTDGKWRVALYLDQRADEKQRKALGDIFSGAAGGHLAALAPLIGEVTGVEAASVSVERKGRNGTVRVGDLLEYAAEELVGGDRKGPIVISNALLGAAPQPMRQGRAARIRYRGPWKAEASGSNAFFTDFKYEA